MSARRWILLAALVLVGLAWAQVGFDQAQGRLRVVRSRAEPVWEQQEAGDIFWLGIARGGPQGDPVVVVQRDQRIHILGLDGKERTNGTVPSGAQSALGDLDNDDRDELLFGAVMDDSGRPSVQAVNQAIGPLGPAVQFLDMRGLSSLLALDLDGDGSQEVALGDFRGCVSTMAYPNFLWDNCIPGDWPSGGPYAARLLGALQDGKLHRLVVARLTGRVRAVAGGGRELWAYDMRGGISDLAVTDLDRDGRGEAVLASPTGGVTVLNADGQALWTVSLEEPVRSLEILEWDGDPALLEIAAGGDEGTVAVFQVKERRALFRRTLRASVADLQRVDPDRDGQDALVAGLDDDGFVVLRPQGPSLSVPLAESPRKLAAREDLLLVGAGSKLNAYRLTEKKAPWWYTAPVAALVFTLVIGAGLRALLRLYP